MRVHASNAGTRLAVSAEKLKSAAHFCLQVLQDPAIEMNAHESRKYANWFGIKQQLSGLLDDIATNDISSVDDRVAKLKILRSAIPGLASSTDRIFIPGETRGINARLIEELPKVIEAIGTWKTNCRKSPPLRLVHTADEMK